MLSNLNKTLSVSAHSTVEENGSQSVIMYMNANINSKGDINMNQSIQDKTLYEKYKDVVVKDLDNFREQVISYSTEIE